MTATRPDPETDPDRAAVRRAVSRALRPFVDGTAKGMSSWVMTEARIAATARDAARAILPLLGSPPRSAHRVRGLIVPVLACGWAELETLYEETLTKLVALPPAIPDVPDPEWDVGLEKPRVVVGGRDWNAHGSKWTVAQLEGETATGPSGTEGRLVRSDRRHALVVEDGRPVRTHARCICSPKQRREHGEVAFELVTFGRARSILEVRAGTACVRCRAAVS